MTRERAALQASRFGSRARGSPASRRSCGCRTSTDGLDGVDVGGRRDPVRHGDELPARAALRPGGDPSSRPCSARSIPAFGIDLFETLGVVDYGDVPVAPGDTPGSLRRIEEGLAPLVEAGVTTLGLGGDHTITLAELRAHAKRHGPLALVQLDAHADTWDEYFGMKESTARPSAVPPRKGFLDTTASVQAGMRGSLYSRGDYDLRATSGSRSSPPTSFVRSALRATASWCARKVGDRPVFVSFDVDFLDPAYAPGTGTPEVAGSATAEAVAFLRALRGIRLAAADVVEVSPSYDGPGQITALAAANVLGSSGTAGRP